jgi:hypothetical protein
MHVLKEDDEARRLAKINKATRILTEEGEDDDNDDDKAHRKFEKELEEARQQAEEAARRKAKEEARHKAEEMRRKALEEARHKEEASWKAKEERRKAIEEASWKAKEERCKAIEEASQKAEEERRKTALAVAMKEATDQNPCQQGAMSGVPHEIEQSHTTDSSESGLTAESVSAKRTLDQSQEEGRPEKVEGLHLKYLEFFFQSAVKEDCKVEETYESPSKYHVYGDDDDDGLEDQLEKKANRLFEVKKGKKKENHWRGIQLVAKDDKIGNALKSSDAICAYCSLCDTFFPYHYSSNSKAPANHKKKCPGKIALQSDKVRMQLREKEKLQEDTKQKLLEVQAKLKEKEKECRQV